MVRNLISSTLLFFVTLVAPLSSSAVDPDQLLPVDEAFAVATEIVGSPGTDERVRMRWRIADGYYLYRHRFGFESTTDGVEIGEAILPAGEEKEDEFFGLVQTYRGEITVDLPVERIDPSLELFTLSVKSQGCADLGVCYPPNRRRIEIVLPAGGNATGVSGMAGRLAGGLGSTSGSLFASDALPVDEAFRFEIIADSATSLLARWTVAPGYYLYRDKIDFLTFTGAAAQVTGFSAPKGVPMVDEHFGDVEVFYDLIEVPVLLDREPGPATTLELTALYQGCKEAGICYPPEERLVRVALPAFDGADARQASGVSTEAPSAGSESDDGFLSEQDRLAAALSTDAWSTLALFFGLGLLLAFTPCVFPMVPILSGIIAGQGEGITTSKAFVLSMVYVLAMALTYTAAGVIAGFTGTNLQAAFQNAWVLSAFALFFAVLSLAMFGFYELQIPASWQTRLNQISNRQEGGTLLGVAIMGFLSALVVGPCVAPPLAAALIYISQTGDPLLGGLALFALSMGMGAPLVVIGTSAGKLLPRAGGWMDGVKAFFGVGLLGLSIWMLERIAPPAVIMLLWGALAVGSAVYLRALDPVPEGSSGWAFLRKAIGVVLLILGALEFVGAAAGGRDYLMPLKGVFGSSGPAASAKMQSFGKIKSIADVEARVDNSGQVAMLDFYADWCVDCKRMEKYTFPEPPVQAALSDVIMLKADVTANDSTDQALLKHFGLIGPPAILFFDDAGNELSRYRVIGYQKPEVFAEHVRLVLDAAGR